MKRIFASLCPILQDERTDYRRIADNLKDRSPFVLLQPAVSPDLTPMAALLQAGILQEAQDAGKPLIWLVSVDTARSSGPTWVEDIVSAFYLRDELPKLALPESLRKLELEEMILLRWEKLPDSFDLLPIGTANVIYLSLTLPDEAEVHCFLCAGTPEQVWNAWTVQEGCSIDWLVDSQRGLVDYFPRTELFRQFLDFDRKALLPSLFYSSQCRPYHLPESFLCFQRDMLRGELFFLYLCPWGQENPPAVAYAENRLRREQAFQQALEDNRAAFAAFKQDPSLLPPLEALRTLQASLLELIRKDGGASDFRETDSMPFYQTYGPNRSPRLRSRAELFSVVAALSLYEDSPEARAAAHSFLDAMVSYHITRLKLSRIYRNAYVFEGATEEMALFADAIYDDVKRFCGQPSFAQYIGSNSQNELELALLETAYLRKDSAFADWLIENNFFGCMPPQLFSVICENDPEKAEALAKRLTPWCISWIVKHASFDARWCFSPTRFREAQERVIPDPPERVFRSIDADTARKVKSYLRKRDTGAQELYCALMEKYFS